MWGWSSREIVWLSRSKRSRAVLFSAGALPRILMATIPVETRVSGPIDLAHAARTQQAEHFIRTERGVGKQRSRSGWIIDYWRTVVAAGIGFATLAVVVKKIAPRESAAKYRVPLLPGVSGSALAKNELEGVCADALQVAAAVPTLMTAGSASVVSVSV